jgi:GNAT superfamily N-acetyltransferase
MIPGISYPSSLCAAQKYGSADKPSPSLHRSRKALSPIHIKRSQAFETVEIRDLPPRSSEIISSKKASKYAAKRLHGAFKQDDERYQTVASTRAVIEERDHSNKPEEKILVRIRTSSKYTFKVLGLNFNSKTHKLKLVGTASLVTEDSPEFREQGKPDTPKYGTGWLADLYTDRFQRKNGHGTAMIEAIKEFADKAGVKGGTKLYAEPENVEFYLKRGFHIIGHEDIPNETKPGETIQVAVMSSEKPKPEEQAAN